MIKNVLIIYHNTDSYWKTKLEPQLHVLKKGGFDFAIESIDVSSFDHIEDRTLSFESAADNAGVIILFISKSLLNSEAMQVKKVKERLRDKQKGGAPLFLLLINKCEWRRLSWLTSLPQFPQGKTYLADMNENDVDSILAEFAGTIFQALGFETKVDDGILAHLGIFNIGPIQALLFDAAPRFNIITGDNGMCKTLLLECAWFALTGLWPKYEALPRPNSKIEEVKIRRQLRTRSGSTSSIIPIPYAGFKPGKTGINREGNSSSLAVYARVDGTFVSWDPALAQTSPPQGFSRPASPLFFDKTSLFNGLKEEVDGLVPRGLCNGLVHDWVFWQQAGSSTFKVFRAMLEDLSSYSGEKLEPGSPGPIPGTTTIYPTIRYSYGDVPLIHTASSVQRIVSLAYLILWTWETHKKAYRESSRQKCKSMVVIIDEVECHLHLQWQRSILPALLKIQEKLDEELEIQFLITTHSPMLLASAEPIFNKSKDKLFHLELSDNEMKLEEKSFERYGDIDNWTTSEAFGLRKARSVEAEEAICDAEKLQLEDKPSPGKVKEVHSRLLSYLGAYDTFWPRWTYFAKQYGVE